MRLLSDGIGLVSWLKVMVSVLRLCIVERFGILLVSWLLLSV